MHPACILGAPCPRLPFLRVLWGLCHVWGPQHPISASGRAGSEEVVRWGSSLLQAKGWQWQGAAAKAGRADRLSQPLALLWLWGVAYMQKERCVEAHPVPHLAATHALSHRTSLGVFSECLSNP